MEDLIAGQREELFHRVSDSFEDAFQFSERSASSHPLDVRIGLDFGTSFTKVVIRVPERQIGYAVPFGRLAGESLEYLLPTELYISDDGVFSAEPVEGATVLDDIKVKLMNLSPPPSLKEYMSPTTAAAGYLALVLRYARRWFVATKEESFGDRRLRWAFNLGLPAKTDDEKLRDRFSLAGRAAWMASSNGGRITLDTVREAETWVGAQPEGLDCDFELVPEVVAEVVGYKNSRERNNGLHLLVDVGARTLDVGSFVLRENSDGDDVIDTLTVDVEILGVLELERERNSVKNHGVGQAEKDFKEKCTKVIGGAIGQLATKKFPNPGDWPDRLYVFLCGGGSAENLYGEVVDEGGEWIRKYKLSQSDGAGPHRTLRPASGIRRLQLPKPSELEAALDDTSHHRLAVAWGLGFMKEDIGIWSRPRDNPDIPRKQPIDYTDRYPGKWVE